MKPENQLTDPENPERQKDLAWIAENQALFWLVATVAYEEIGYGALLVDLISEPLEQGHPFSYYAEGELELEDKNIRRLLFTYDPGREFVVALLKPGDQVSVYCGRRPDIGWMSDLTTFTRFLRPDAGP